MWSPKGPPVMVATPGQPTQRYGSGAVNYQTGKTGVLFRRHQRRREIAELRQALLERHPGQTGYVAWDNASTHEDEEVDALVRSAAGRLVLLYLPTDSPWLNPMEMLWRQFRREVTHCELFETIYVRTYPKVIIEGSPTWAKTGTFIQHESNRATPCLGKQVTGLERCQCRKARIQRNHIGGAFLVGVRLKHWAAQTGRTAWLGLVAKQHTSRGKVRRLGISKRGDGYLRPLLIHGAHPAVQHATQKSDAHSRWINSLRQRREKNITVIALANKNTRILWTLLATGEPYRQAS